MRCFFIVVENRSLAKGGISFVLQFGDSVELRRRGLIGTDYY